MTIALQYEESLRGSKSDVSRVPVKSVPSYSSRQTNGPVPMELGTMNAGCKQKQGAAKKVRCFNCNLYGHFARDCRKPKKGKLNAMETEAKQPLNQ